MQGQQRIAELCDRFPALPRSILVKTDILRDGVRYTPEIEAAGASSLRCNCWSCDLDFPRLLDGCSCSQCA